MRKTEKKSIAVIDDEVQMLKVIGRYVTETLKQKNMTDKINVRLVLYGRRISGICEKG